MRYCRGTGEDQATNLFTTAEEWGTVEQLEAGKEEAAQEKNSVPARQARPAPSLQGFLLYFSTLIIIYFTFNIGEK
jgi:hypothetical protein